MNTTTHPQPLRDILKLEKGKPPLQTPYNGPGSERYLTPDFLRGKAAPEYARPNSTAIRVTDGDVIILWDGSNAGEVLKARDGMLASTMMKVIHNSDYDTGFFYYALKGWEDYLKGQTSGSGIPHVDKEILGDLSIFNCKKLEQAKIAEILSTVDQAIDQTEALITKQQRIKTGLMQDLLTRGIDKDGNLRSEDTHEFKDSPFGRIPVEWKVERGVSVCDEIVVGIVIRPTQYYREDGIPTLRSANIQENRIDPSHLVYMSVKDNAQLRKSQVRRGDLVTVRTGYPGATTVIPPEFDGCNCVDIVISRPNSKKVRSQYLSLWINSYHGKLQILKGQGGLAQQHFNVSEMKNLLIKVPMLNEQERIETLLLTHAETIREARRNLAKLEGLKTALMQDLLTGKVSVTHLLTEADISI